MPWRGPEVPGEFPSLGNAVADFIENGCAIPDGEHAGKPFILTEEQLRFLHWHYRLHPDASIDLAKPSKPFVYRRSQLVRPQKWGKGPLAAALVCAEAAGPVLFAGWDADGEPVGRPWATPLIQVTAVSEDQTDNVWRALVPMIELGDIAADIPDTGETRINLPAGGRIEPVTASARSRLGQRITFAVQDQALALDTPLPTPTGWVTMGDVTVGDYLIGSDGLPVEVVKTTTPSSDHRCYRVWFHDGTSLVASAGHLWKTRVARSAALPRIRTTDEMAEDGRRFLIPRPRPLKTPDVPLPLDPYLLGLWLGDGTTKGSQLTAIEADARFYIDQIHEMGEHATSTTYGDRATTISLGWNRGRVTEPPSVFQRLRLLDVLGNKHIPASYLRAGTAQRVALVQGLMDTDGCVTESGFCTFVGTSKALVEGVVEALRSLGQVVSMVWRSDGRYTAGGAYKVNFTPVDLVPFRLPRKVERVREAKARREWVSVKSIETVASVPVRCVGVHAADRLFLAGDGFHVTHNTESWLKRNGGHALADNQRRGLAGMGGRSIETPNAWDPNESSVAQLTYERHPPDVYIDYPLPPKGSVRNKRERHRVLKVVYGDAARSPRPEYDQGHWSPWVDLDRIDSEAEELILRGDAGQAERWFLNRILPGADAAFDPAEWAGLVRPEMSIADNAVVTLGFDGARRRDSTGIIVTDIESGLQVVHAVWERPEHADDDWEISEHEVDTAMTGAFDRYDVWRLYADPPYWETTVDRWAGRWPKRVVSWWTNRPRPMALALRAYRTSIGAGEVLHDGNPTYATHIANARRVNQTGMVDEEGRPLWLMAKSRPDSPDKIDLAMAGCLSWEARGDAIADGALNRRRFRVAGF